MTTRFLGFVGSLSSSEQQFRFPNQNVQAPDTWTLPHLIQLLHEYKKLVEDFNCDIQEFITVLDPPDPPSNIIHLTPLTSLHAATTRNMELPNFISSTHEGMTTLKNKYWHWLKYTDQYVDAWAISSSHTENFPHDKWTRFESSTLLSQWPSFCVDTSPYLCGRLGFVKV